MKKTMMIIFSVVLFVCANSQTNKPKPMTAADSAAVQQAEATRFVDSILAKTTLKDFQTFLYENVSGKEYNEGPFVRLYDYFLRTKYEQWMMRKQQQKKN